MDNIAANKLNENIFSVLERTIKYNEPIQILAEQGSAVLLSAEDYNGLIETVYLNSLPGTINDIEEGMSEPYEDCVSADDIEL